MHQATKRRGRINGSIVVFAGVCCVLASVTRVVADEIDEVWTGNSSNSWNDPGNWDQGIVPNNADGSGNTYTALIDTFVNAITIDSSVTVSNITQFFPPDTNSITLENGQTLTIANGGFISAGGLFTTAQTLTAPTKIVVGDGGSNQTAWLAGVVLTDPVNAQIVGAATDGSDTLGQFTQVHGTGQISGFASINQSSLYADDSAGRPLTVTQTRIMNSHIEADNGASLILANSQVFFGTATISDGSTIDFTYDPTNFDFPPELGVSELTTSGTGKVRDFNFMAMGGNQIDANGNHVSIEVEDGATLRISGTGATVNNGIISTAPTLTSLTTIECYFSPILNGSGSLVLTDSNFAEITSSDVGTTTLVNGSQHTIAGAGFVTNLLLTNNGTINANVAGQTLNLNDTLTNLSGTTLIGGTYMATGGTLQMTGANIVTNSANIVLDGSTAQIVDENNHDALANLNTTSSGASLTVTNGRNFTTAGDYENDGSTTAGPNSIFTVTGNLTNNGSVTAQGGSVVVQGNLTNFSGTTLNSGTYNAVGGTIQFTGANIVTNAATIVLDGAGSSIVNEHGANALTNLSTITSTGALHIRDGMNLTTGSLSNAGSIYVGADTPFFIVPDTSVLTVNGDLSNTGYIQLNSTTLNVNGTFTNSGTFTSDPASVNMINLDIEPGSNFNTSGGDTFKISGNLTDNDPYPQVIDAELEFTSGFHEIDLNGELDSETFVLDPGAATIEIDGLGFLDIFGQLQLGVDGMDASQLADFSGSGTIIYNPDSNEYLNFTFANLDGGGQIAPSYVVPEPGSLSLLAVASVGLLSAIAAGEFPLHIENS